MLEWLEKDLEGGVCNKQIAGLVAAVEAKGKILSPRGTQIFFWLNNLSFILNKTKGALDALIIKKDLNEGLESRIEDLLAQYEDYTWAELNEKVFSNESAEPKKRMEDFNRKFRETYRGQKIFRVMNPVLAKRIRDRNVELIAPKYEALLKNVGSTGKHDKTVKYSVEDLTETLNKFFT